LAETDPLTQLLNQRALDQQLRHWLDSVPRPLSMLIVDVDEFKSVNDHFGHLAGDECLRQIARLLKTFSADGLAARYGGDEFVLIWPLGDRAASERAERLRSAVEALGIPQAPSRKNRVATLSVGIASILDGEADFSAAFGRADRALYAAKVTRNRVVLADA
jgi:diguanylate cyclase (GGDEF)-like protein